tara:strand:+ start:29941 stop:31146 length:1206 start_codon:yes stop_codon:yes gene_type:complete
MDEKLKAELETLTKGLEAKTSEEVKAAVDAFETKVNESIANETKAVKESFEAEIKGIKESMAGFAGKEAAEAMQKHLDAMDIKLQNKAPQKKEVVSFETGVKSLVEENFEKISQVRKGNSAKLEVKTVGNMTLANLSGDQPRDYSGTVAAVPSQLVNFTDLTGAPINISGGTYTFPRETGAGEGSISTQTEGNSKSQRDYDLTMVDVNTDFLAGYAVYSKKMANNLPFLQSFLPSALRRDYLKAENSLFATTLASAATASSQIITSKNKIEMLINEIATLEGIDFAANGIVVRPADWYDIAKTEKSTGSGYGLPGIVAYSNGVLTINGIPVYKANWIAANKYFVGDWSRVKKVVTEGLSLEFSNEDSDNFRKNNITARIEAQIGLAIERTDAVIYGDFTAT